jgi:hypothetical protein
VENTEDLTILLTIKLTEQISDMKNRTRRHLDKIQTYENAHNKPYSYIVDDYIKNQFTEDQYNAYNVAGNSPSALS